MTKRKKPSDDEWWVKQMQSMWKCSRKALAKNVFRDPVAKKKARRKTLREVP